MALADYQSNALTSPQGGGDFDIYAMHANQRYQIGMRIKRVDGNEYVYSHFLTDSTQAKLVGPDVSEGGEVAGVDNAFIAPASTIISGDNAIGSKFLEMTNAGIVADEHAGGYISIVSGTGNGYTYRIKGNTATGNPNTNTMRFELHDPLVLALSTSSDVNILGSRYAQLILVIGAGGENNLTVGVTVSNVVVATAPYAWVLVKGLMGALADGTMVAGGALTLSDGKAGAVQPQGGGSTATADIITEQVIGQCVIPDASTGLAMCNFDFG